MTRILVIDDHRDTLVLLKDLFGNAGYIVDTVNDGDQARERLRAIDYDVVFTDLRLGYPYDGLEILELVQQARPRAQVIIMTAFSSVESSVLAIKGGAYDYITKPFNREELLLLAARAAERAQLTLQVQKLEEAAGGGETAPILREIVGKSPQLVEVMGLVAQVAKTDATALILGESGTGKELVAQALHQLSTRSENAFVPVNCGAIPENLQESEFFGHVKGAFTGAVRTSKGLFARADSGTLFLDEVGETSFATQVKLLRFLQSGEVRPVGDNVPLHVDVRLVAATNRDLHALIEEKKFREDLYYRLNIITIEVPPLRHREGDVDLLAEFFLTRVARKLGNGVTGFSRSAMRQLRAYGWPGNVRELENAVERAVTLARGTRVEVDDLPRLGDLWRPGSAPRQAGRKASKRAASTEGPATISRFKAPEPADPWEMADRWSEEGGRFPSLEDMERRHILAALEFFEGHRGRTSEALGISKVTLWRKIKAYEITA